MFAPKQVAFRAHLIGLKNFSSNGPSSGRSWTGWFRRLLTLQPSKRALLRLPIVSALESATFEPEQLQSQPDPVDCRSGGEASLPHVFHPLHATGCTPSVV